VQGLRRYESLEISVFFEAGRGSVWPKISDRRGRPPPTILRVRKLDELNFIWCKNVGRTFFRFDGQADGRTDGFTIAKAALHTMQRGNVCTLTSHMTK